MRIASASIGGEVRDEAGVGRVRLEPDARGQEAGDKLAYDARQGLPLRTVAAPTLTPMPAITAIVTGYCHCQLCCGEMNRPTASGKMPTEMCTIAAPRKIPLGTPVKVEGVGYFLVQDRMSKKYPKRWDIYFATHREAKAFGKKKLKIEYPQL